MTATAKAAVEGPPDVAVPTARREPVPAGRAVVLGIPPVDARGAATPAPTAPVAELGAPYMARKRPTLGPKVPGVAPEPTGTARPMAPVAPRAPASNPAATIGAGRPTGVLEAEAA